MPEHDYRVTPDPTRTTMPPGVPFIIGNELAERFSFYGMKCILTVFMTKHLLDASGAVAPMSDIDARVAYHNFTAAAYFFPILGAIIADVYWGKYKTILLISLMYCLGHGTLALMDLAPGMNLPMWPFLFAGMALIAVGAGGIKPCVSAHVGDQFGTGNKHLLTQVFNWFYFAINLGSAISTFLTPILLELYGPWLAFGLPGVLMGMATFLFWLGRNKFVHIQPSGWKQYKEEVLDPRGVSALLNLAPLFLIFVPFFWCIFEQTGSAWVQQARSMDRTFGGRMWLESQVQVVNPVLILILIPTFTYGVYPLMGKFFEPTPLRKIGIGLFMTAAAFGISAMIEARIAANAVEGAASLWGALQGAGIEPGTGQGADSLDAALRAATAAGWEEKQIQPSLGMMPNIGWQFFAYVVLTAAEVMVSIVCLEFAYTQAPPRMKSLVMGVFFMGVSLGSIYTSIVNSFIEIKEEVDPVTGDVLRQAGSRLEGASYYLFFAGLMAVVSVVYVFYAKFMYKGRTYIQGEDPNVAHAEAAAEGPDAR